MKFITALIAGALFGCGLLLSGMAKPLVVLGFLDVTGAWNPALAFTMAGAILVAAPAYFFVRRRGSGLGGAAVTLPGRTRIDRSLLGGAAIFGLGWGLAGICPGPALLLLTGMTTSSIVFVSAMFTGFLIAMLPSRS